jgi:hypothetical protein
MKVLTAKDAKDAKENLGAEVTSRPASKQKERVSFASLASLAVKMCFGQPS